MTGERWRTLPCGRDPQRLLDSVADEGRVADQSRVADHARPDAHEATCAYCQAARREMEALWSPIRQWAGQEVHLPREFLATVVARVRRLVQSPRHVAAIGAAGATTVSSWVLSLIASTATRDTTGVALVTGGGVTAPGAPPGAAQDRRRQARDGADGVDVTEEGDAAVAVALGVTADVGPSLVALADQIRGNVITAIAAGTHIEVAEVDVRIDDLEARSRSCSSPSFDRETPAQGAVGT